FKEFLIGHPALITGIYFLKKTEVKKVYSKLFILAGVLGQASVINSFMHIHTPIGGTVIRTFWGYIIGGIIAAAVITFFKIWQKYQR
ncbi:MAG: DUF5693 family protein, partial [Elusimicrobia bacterium]|nr:DUF5693 family protein [Elusimicrobiota bacterium]